MSTPATVFTTTADQQMAMSQVAFTSARQKEFKLVCVYPSVEFQTLSGFGGAVTQTVAQLYWGLPEQQRQKFLEEHFSPEGRNYKLVRTPVQSCDFGPGPHAYVNHVWQNAETAFDMSKAEEQVIPLLQEIARFNPDVEFMVTPWSPPAFMKTTHMMRFGGHLWPGFENEWAYIIARYVHELRQRGIPVTRLSVQNEPRARQVWESCLMGAEQEARLARKIRKQLKSFGITDVKILAWDHNKERLFDRIQQSKGAWGAEGNPFDGWAFHWYAGDHFEALRAAASQSGLGEFIMSEACEFHTQDEEARNKHAEQYAHAILGDLNAGAHGWIDWNMMLDDQGGPTYVSNFCSAPVVAHVEQGTWEKLPSATYIQHFSQFIKPGAKRVLASTHTADLEVTAWKNPDGSLVCIVLNRYWYEIPCDIKVGESCLELASEPHSIKTIVWNGASSTR